MVQDNIPSLGRIFWLHAALPRGAALAAIWALGTLQPLPFTLLAGLLACDILLFAWQLRRFQRSADDHIRHRGGLAPVWGGQLAFLFAAFAMASLWWGAFLNAGRPAHPELFTDRMDRQHAATYSLTVAPGGQELQFQGMITFGLTGRLQEILAQNPDATTLTLTSPGGQLYEARGAAKIILAYGLDTHAEGECASACTLLFAAGTSRSMAPDARLGFHGYGLESGGSLPHVDVGGEQEKDLQFFRSRGVRQDFTAQIFKTPPDGMFFITQREASAAGLLSP